MTTTASTTTTPWLIARHYLAMVVAMFAGMFLFGWLRGLAGLTVGYADSPAGSFLLMATDMSVAMIIWMRVRRHSWVMTLQMAAVMYLPALLLPLVASGVLSAMIFMVVAHLVMFGGMLAVLLHHHRRPGRP